MSDSTNFKVNFFKPLTNHARANTKLIKVLFLIWAVSVFGFQVLLMIFNKPTPEPNYVQFKKDWPSISENASATLEMRQEFSRTVLSLLGKNIALNPKHKDLLKKTLVWSIYHLLPEENRPLFLTDLKDNPENAQHTAIQAIELKEAGFDKIRIDLLPSSLMPTDVVELTADELNSLPKIFELYLVHNRSGLTDTRFLGFPFHYWYTAQFLLILFVLLCFAYAKITDKQNVKHNFIEED